MSNPSTPSQSPAASATSTPSSTHRTMATEQLTPRSKVKAMLAALDDDSDDALPHTGKTPANGKKTIVTAKRSASPQALKETDTSESDESAESDIIRPRGKLAARLRGQRAASRDVEPSADGPVESTNVYERIKQQLLQKSPEPKGAAAADREEGSEAEILPMRRTLLRKKKQPVITEIESNSSHSKLSLSRRSSPTIATTPEKSRSVQRPTSPTSSPGLFMTPTATRTQTPPRVSHNGNGSDSDLPAGPQANARFLALVAKKREEREAKAAAEEKKKAARKLQAPRELEENIEDDDDDVGGKLTRQARPTRKAGKKALEEMSRETQRMSRNMQLAHQAKTKKKITKESLLAKFNFRCNPTPPATLSQANASSSAANSAPVSDTEGAKEHQTPPTSPIKPDDSLKDVYDAKVDQVDQQIDSMLSPEESLQFRAYEEDDLPSIQDIMNAPSQPLDKGKGKADEGDPADLPQALPKTKKPAFTQPPIRVRPPKHPNSGLNLDSEPDDILEIIPMNKSRRRKLDIFDKVPTKKITEGRSLQTLRALAHLTSPSKQNDKSRASMTSVEMNVSLHRRARQQAAEVRAERIQDARNRGFVIQTAEERHRDQAEVEDLLEKARQEGAELRKKEKDATKQERKENGLDDETSDDDEDYCDADEPSAELEVSGSEDEADDEAQEIDSAEESNDDEGEEEDMDAGVASTQNLIENEASEDSHGSESQDEVYHETDEDEIEDQLPVVSSRRRPRASRVLDDDDIEDEEERGVLNVSPQKARNPFAPQLPGSDEAPMGLTQAFAATMAETQTQTYDDMEGLEDEQDSLAFLRGMPDPDFPMGDSDLPKTVVPDSQIRVALTRDNTNLETQGLELHFSQSQIEHDTSPRPSQLPPSATQLSEIPDPTQDAGFGPSSLLGERFVSAPPSTVDTVLLPDEESLIVKKRGRLQRRTGVVPALSDADSSNEADGNGHLAENVGFRISANAFDVMKKAKNKPTAVLDPFDKKKTQAKGMVEEQAEESEDEYAGLGGASDDDSMAEEDEEVRKMMDDGDVKVDERKLAAFYADNERANDEQVVNKLYKDVTTGGLRRKRATEFDLSDSEDDREARVRAKRREFAKMRKALLEDENVGKIAEDPKKLAFLRAIEDREEDEDNDFLGQAEKFPPAVLESQENLASEAQPSVLEITTLKRKRPLQESVPGSGNRAPAPARGVQKIKKPSTLAEIRESVSFLIEEPAAFHGPHSSDSDLDVEDAPTSPRAPFVKRRATNPNPVIDRLSLKRASSSLSASTITTSGSRPAFFAADALPQPGFRVPSLLRRATTQLTSANAADANGISTMAGTERAAGGGEKGDFVRRGGTKKSSVNWYAREMERSKKVREVERRKEEGVRRVGEMRRGVLGGVLGRGGFD
ncbi:hypothetical protein MMC30_006753 [Trapelia coarctata]|nr:hypothetical protein [Trapelia coarctata]